MKKEDCNFCDVNVNKLPHFPRWNAERIDNTVIIDTPSIKVKPDILPGNPNMHLLAIPKAHKFGYATMPEVVNDLGQIMRTVMKKAGEYPAFFEHGGLGEGDKKLSVYHVHGHIYGSKGMRLVDYMRDRFTSFKIPYINVDLTDASPAKTIQDFFKENKLVSYIFAQQGRDAVIALDHDDSFPSQVTQKSMHELFSGAVLDWKQLKDPDTTDLARLSLNRMSNIIKRFK